MVLSQDCKECPKSKHYAQMRLEIYRVSKLIDRIDFTQEL